MKQLNLTDFFTNDLRIEMMADQLPKLTVDFTGRFSLNQKLLQEYTDHLSAQEQLNAMLGARSPYYFSVGRPLPESRGYEYLGILTENPEHFSNWPYVNINDKGSGSKMGVASVLLKKHDIDASDLKVETVERKVGTHTKEGLKLTFYPDITLGNVIDGCLTFPMILHNRR